MHVEAEGMMVIHSETLMVLPVLLMLMLHPDRSTTLVLLVQGCLPLKINGDVEQGFSFARVYPSQPNFALNGMSTTQSLQTQLFAVATTAGCFVPLRFSLCGGFTLKTRVFG